MRVVTGTHFPPLLTQSSPSLGDTEQRNVKVTGSYQK